MNHDNQEEVANPNLLFWVRQNTSITGCVRRSVTHLFDDPHVAPIGLLGLVVLAFTLTELDCPN